MYQHAWMLLIAALLGACGSSDEPQAGAPITETRAGSQSHIVLESQVDGADISFELFEPDQLEPGQAYPLILHSHGYGGSRITSRDGFVARLTAAGYYVISIDQRGFGESGGTVRVLSPDFEGRDLIQILDWAEDLPGLARDTSGNMALGSYGGSYGGGYQLLVLRMDPDNRLDALVPDITWHDLRYSLSPNGVIKSGYVLALAAGGETGSNLGQDMFIRESLIQGAATNVFPQPARNLFAYHSPIFNCEMQDFAEQGFLLATSDPGEVAARPLPRADVLLTQGMRDVLFNFNEAFANYQCLQRAGGDVRLFTHESGHILPVALPEELKDGIDAAYQLINIQDFQNPGGARNCGDIDLTDLQFAWFEEKLRGVTGAIDAVLKGAPDVCLSLGADDAVGLREVPVGGVNLDIDQMVPQFSSVLGVTGSLLGNGLRELLLADVPLTSAGDSDMIIAGIPTLQLTVSGLSGLELDTCVADELTLGCDPQFWLGLAIRKAGESRATLIDDQLTPIRGFGQFGTAEAPFPMTGIAERLGPGDELVLQIYGFHLQYPISFSRDVLVPAASFSGSIQLPLLNEDGTPAS